MSLFGRLRNAVRAAVARARLEREMGEEIREHLAQAAERFERGGLSADLARLAARREFGNLAVVQEEARDARGGGWIGRWLGDLRHAVRLYARTPLTTAAIFLTLTLGIGASAAAAAILSGLLTRPAPGVPADESLVAIRGIHLADGRREARGVSYLELLEYSRLPVFAAVTGWTTSIVVTELPGQEPGTALGQFVTPNFFTTLGLQLSAGAGFGQRRLDEHREPELSGILAHRFAVEAFGVAEAAVGRTLMVNGVGVTIVGVAPPRFLGPIDGGMTRTLWLPLSAWPVVDRPRGDPFATPADSSFLVAGRLRGGVPLSEATAAAAVIASRTAVAIRAVTPREPGATGSFGADVVPLRGNLRLGAARTDTIERVGLTVGLVSLILLVSMTTVSSLLVGAAVTRRREIAVRLALGASRGRVVRQLLGEGAALALVAGAAGLTLYALLSRGLRATVVDVDVDPGWGTALVTVAVAAVTSLLFGLAPALHATRGALSGVLGESTTTVTAKSRAQRLLVLAQVALTQPLLVGLAMLIAIVGQEGARRSARLGEHLVLATFDTYSAASRQENRVPALQERLAAVPGVAGVTPQTTGFRIFRLEVAGEEGAPARRFDVRTHQVPPGYFEALEVPLLRGRELRASDTVAGATPIVIGSDFAEAAFAGVDPIGRRLATLARDQDRRTGQVEVVGVVAASAVGRSESSFGIRVFTPMGGPLAVPDPGPDALLIRTLRPAAPLIPMFRAIARAEAPMTPVRDMKTLAQIDRDARSEIVEAAGAAALGGGLALLLAAIGLYALVALAVGQRRREIGVRLSLGADPDRVVRMFFRNGLRVSLTGLLIGLPLAVGALRLVATRFGFPSTNGFAIAAVVAGAVVAVASLASWIPARRAAGVDPLIALRDG